MHSRTPSTLWVAEIIHHNHMPGAQLRARHFFDVGQEDLAIGGRFHGHDGEPAGVVQCTQDCEPLPVAARNRILDPLTA